MKRALLAIAAGLVLTASVSGQPYGGPGMMGGNWGQGGYGMMGPGMMGGYGGGPGYGPGPGYGMGPGHGMGPGMMGGGYGPGGMMQGYGPGGCNTAGPDLSAEQREKIAAIQSEFQPRQWALMQKMHETGWRSMDGPAGGKFDEQAARKSYDAMAELRKQMFVNSLEAQKRIDAVLTPQQREQLRRGPPGR